MVGHINSFLKLARQYHPDLHPGDNAAAEKFKEINEANEVLSDEKKRKNYDNFGDPNGAGFGGAGAGAGGFGGFGGFEDIFGDIFGGFGGRSQRAQTKTKGDDVTVEVTLSFLDAAKGTKRDITYQRKEPCKDCKGTGAKGGTQYSTCQNCKGTGEVQYMSNNGFFRSVNVRACPECGGKGKKIIDKCASCSGRGYNKANTTVTLDIPAGADTNSYMKKRGYGNASTLGGESGDLIVVFKVLPHKIFKRKKFDLYIELPISYKLAVLGGKVKIPTLDDAVEFTIPEGTQSGKTFMVKNKGIKSRLASGDLYVTVVVEIPTKLSRSAKSELEKFDDKIESKQYEKIKKFEQDMQSLYGVDYRK